jgi:hypothetical protein
MSFIKGYIDYQRREFCKDIKCPVQLDLDKQEPGSEAYEGIRNTCKADCRYTTYQFHHWLIDKGYLIVRPGAG